MKYIKQLMLILAALISTYSSSFAAGSLEIKDTIIERGRVYKIPVYGTIPSSSANIIQLEFIFDAMVLDIKKADGDNNYGLPADLIYNFDFSNIKKSKITISSASYKKKFSGTICVLEIEGLAGIDTTSNIEPVSMLFDNDSLPEINLIKGNIKVNSFPVEPKFIERLGQNYPNPFSDQTTFPFSIDKETNVNFKMYSLNGKLLNEQSELNDVFRIAVNDENGNAIDKPYTYRFNRGNYKIVLKPYLWKLSSGAYCLILRTDTGVYRMNFIYIK
jgi:hypothetical protein